MLLGSLIRLITSALRRFRSCEIFGGELEVDYTKSRVCSVMPLMRDKVELLFLVTFTSGFRASFWERVPIYVQQYRNNTFPRLEIAWVRQMVRGGAVDGNIVQCIRERVCNQ